MHTQTHNVKYSAKESDLILNSFPYSITLKD